MAPLIHGLSSNNQFDLKVCSTAQHREMLDQILGVLEITPDYDLDAMKVENDLGGLTAALFSKFPCVLDAYKPDLVLVHGDTTTSFVAAMSAYYKRVPVGHVEAGLRTNNIYSPWPEEVNRKIIATIAKYHFAPTEMAKNNLISEGVEDHKIFVTGNTVVDTLFWVLKKIEGDADLKDELTRTFSRFNSQMPLILVTGHRRENFGEGFEQICCALKRIATAHPLCQIVYPVHLNPKVREPVNRLLKCIDNIHIVEPLDYVSFVYLMSIASFIITDSGGIQEEAPSIGKPVLVMRENTERPEAVSAGTVILTGTRAENIFDAAERLLLDRNFYLKMSKSYNPYGDGNACTRIIDRLSV
jgi:UDP-N-acetylglucosamine 2-epimerase (non-hydrolysing)